MTHLEMGKRKSRKRKQRLARPPKKKTPVRGLQWEYPTAPPDFDSWDDGAEAAPNPLGAPPLPRLRPEAERPFGAVHPSMYGSTRYRKFRDNVVAIRAIVPEALKSFATYDVPDLKQRRWLNRYSQHKKAGKLADWQVLILEEAGFNWQNGRKPVEKARSMGQTRAKKPVKKALKKKRKPTAKPKQKPASKKKQARPKPKVRPKPKLRPKKKKEPTRHELAWMQAYEALRVACKGVNPDLAMRSLLLSADHHYGWLQKQVLAARSGKLKAERRALLEALPFDFEVLIADPQFTQWRKSFKAYADGELNQVERWAALQAKARQKGALPEWRMKALDTIGFDWDKALLPPGYFKMEARWREKLETYLELEALHGKPLNTRLDAVKPLRPWISRMREQYQQGRLHPKLVAEFEARGFEFRGLERFIERRDKKWERQFAKLEAFKARFGHTRVPSSYAEDPEFGAWLAHQRESWKLGKLRPERIARFQALGLEPTYGEQAKAGRTHLSVWLRHYQKLVAYLESEYDGRLPKVGRISDKDRIWLKRQRSQLQAGVLEPWQIEKLEAIHFNPKALPQPPPLVDWDERMQRLRRFVQAQGHARVSRSDPDSKLYAFVQRVRKQKRLGKLSPEKERELRAVGFSFDPYHEVSKAWMRQYEALQRYRQSHGDCLVPRSYPQDQGLAEFVAQQKQRGRKGLLLAEHIRLLDQLDFPWSHGQPTPKDR